MSYFLKKLYKIGIIRLIDFYFASIFTSNKQECLKYSISLLSNSISKGNICLPISKLYLDIHTKDISFLKKIKEINKVKDWEKKLFLNNKIISYGQKITPIIFENNCLYLYKIWEEENIIIKNFIKNNFFYIEPNKIKHIFNILFDNNDNKNIFQKEALCAALTHRISIISGSPGTGKTSIISKIIFTFIKIFKEPLKIKVVSTTGKSSVRLIHSINTFFKKISLNLMNEKEKKSIPKKSSTIHHLLKMNIYTKKSLYNNQNSLNLDLLIIDEASMIDFNLMSIILKALPKKINLILLGDEYQLPSIEYGSMLKDLCYFKKFFFTKQYFLWLNSINNNNKLKENYNIPKFFFRNFITELQHNYRYSINSNINKLAIMIKKGNIKKIKKLFLKKNFDVNFINVINKKKYISMIDSFIHKYEKYFVFLKKQNNNYKNILHYFNNFQIICAIKNGLFGTKTINNIIEKELFNKKNLIHNIEKNNWYIGKPIIITQNNNFLNLFNGDIGITFFDKVKKKLKIKFLLANGKYKIISIKNLPSYDIAYAITVHKSQGSEFNNISLVLPNKFSSILTRELIYTAITRAKKKINIYSQKSIFYKAIKIKIKRYSNIKRKIINYLK
ncbi:exodeoxyribonuclease V subunit alpha [Enterobacteriaceae endosymbiont of Donacia simplex]|uniref:exodeoxyribonuclease V subunit alpha n=1 Tax=Enterobacteriaceae endosymbiont of Donacia simplex TaxID=2675784 RepID=UPI001449B305|nr:exodeoxyribonuclease V subunit alpha [Enterobacteriaceae endosymbiont of Donacia simplex]QJC36682.1 exodeoxyribonuclease V subunit alpha [Enterobacteriaceae endosymbiont of Donacia simplex]